MKMLMPADVMKKVNAGLWVDLTPPIRHHKDTKKKFPGVDRLYCDGLMFGKHLRNYDGTVSFAEIAYSIAMQPAVAKRQKAVFPMIEDNPVWNCCMEVIMVGKMKCLFFSIYEGDVPQMEVENASDSDVSRQ